LLYHPTQVGLAGGNLPKGATRPKKGRARRADLLMEYQKKEFSFVLQKTC